MLRDKGPMMIHAVSGKKVGKVDGANGNGTYEGQTIGEVVGELDGVIGAAQKVQSPLHLGSAARNLLLLAQRRLGKDARDWEVVRFWERAKE